MRIAIVSLATLRRHGRWDATYYLPANNTEAELVKARKRLADARVRVAQLEADIRAETFRVKTLVEVDGVQYEVKHL